MAKYRLLTITELQELEKEFINFLILNSISADEWEQLKKEDSVMTDHVIGLFSDVVFERIMGKVEFLEYWESKEIKTFHCLADKLVLVGIALGAQSNMEFTDSYSIHEAIINQLDSVKIYTSEKFYTKQREMELFEMTQAGCTISDGKLFKKICLALPL